MLVMEQLKKAYQELKKEQPKLRIYNAAQQLGVSEMELLVLSLGDNVKRLKDDFRAILLDIHQLGEVMALTRNEYVVHERKGVYNNVSFMKGAHGMGLAVNEDIDLRLFMNAWAYGYAVTLTAGKRTLYGFQFFNKYGEAVHKIYTTNHSDVEAYQKVVDAHTHEDQTTKNITISTDPRPVKEYAEDSAVDMETFHKEWTEMEDTHHFFGMLRKHKLARTQALRLAPEGYTYQVPTDAIVGVFEAAAAQEVPIMVFVNSGGCIQIHTGPVKKLAFFGDWYNVLDNKFNLHLNMNSIAEAWVVKKQSEAGIVTSLELFDKNGELIVYCFGKRKPGIPELEGWRAIIEALNPLVV